MRTLAQAYDPAGAPAPAMPDLRAAPAGAATRTELEAVALRAASANGFGAGPADVGNPEPTGRGQGVLGTINALLQHWRDARRLRAERLILSQVDSATLRDLGLEAADPHQFYAALGGRGTA